MKSLIIYDSYSKEIERKIEREKEELKLEILILFKSLSMWNQTSKLKKVFHVFVCVCRGSKGSSWT
jgi:hypothetical protein